MNVFHNYNAMKELEVKCKFEYKMFLTHRL